MPPRKTHSKSRYGCQQCKQRRVKCDETGPPCRHCARREIECDYLSPPKRQAEESHTEGSNKSATRSPSSSIEVPWTDIISGIFHLPTTFAQPQPLSTRMRDLELMHHYSTVTYITMSQVPVHAHVWKVLIPEEALKYGFLMDGILSLSALHIAFLRPEVAQIYADLALEYQNSALLGFKGALNHISPENCHAIFAFSIITTVLAFALSGSYREVSINAPTGNLIDIFELMRGIGAVIDVSKVWLGDGKFGALFHATSSLDFLSPGQEIQDALDELRRHNDETIMAVSEEQHRIYSHAIDELWVCFKRLATTPDRGIVLGWPLLIDQGFITMFKHDDPMAMLVFLYYGVLLHRINDQWWAGGIGDRIVKLLCCTIHGARPDLDNLTETAWREVGIVDSAHLTPQCYDNIRFSLHG